MSIGAIPGITRGCGRRVQGGIYIETGLSPRGKPVEAFLLDPPTPFNPDHKRGVEIVEDNEGICHVVDWIGEQHYREVADYVEEVRNFGQSRRVPESLEFERLSARSRYICVHARAYITNADELESFTAAADEAHNTKRHCQRYRFASSDHELHVAKPGLMCSRHHWIYAVPTLYWDNRTMPSFIYALTPPPNYWQDDDSPAVPAQYEPAAFAAFPISRIAVIAAEDGSHVETQKRLADRIGGSFSVDTEVE